MFHRSIISSYVLRRIPAYLIFFSDDWDPEEELDEETMEQLADEAEAQFRKRNANRDGFRYGDEGGVRLVR
jgi:hypothetical protein